MHRNETTPIDNGQDIIDSRDIIARLAFLRQELDELETALEDANSADVISEDEIKAAEKELAAWKEENLKELKDLTSLEEELEGYGDWKYGETLIRETYFEQYAQDLAEDLGLLKGLSDWPATCIDWEKAAEELQQDYTSADFDGVTYYMRA